MNSIKISLVALTIVFGGAMLGMVLGLRLPDHYLTPDSIAHGKLGASSWVTVRVAMKSNQFVDYEENL
jgi:hypothetical protein